MNEAIEAGIGQRGFSDAVVPLLLRDLGGDDRGVEIVTVLQDLEQCGWVANFMRKSGNIGCEYAI